jgi:hypothetical protein
MASLPYFIDHARIKGRFAPNDPTALKFVRDRAAALASSDGPEDSLSTSSSSGQGDGSAPTYDGPDAFGRALLDRLGLHESVLWPACRDLSLEKAQMFLEQYKSMSQAAPFAIQIPLLAISDLLATCPILAVSAILTGSSSAPEFEKQAEDMLRHVLADRVIIKGQTSLEILQAFLTYMTWHHHRFDPETHQFYQFLQLANGMVADLELPKKFKRISIASFPQEDGLNEMRAFLGCFYLNGVGAVLGYDHPANLHCIDSLRNAAKMLETGSATKQDKNASAVVELLYVVTHNHNLKHILGPDATPQTPTIDLLRKWEQTHLHAKTSATLRSSFHFVKAYTLLKSSGATGPSAADVQTCMHHFRELLTNVLNQRLRYLIQIGIGEWAHVITTLFLLARLGTSTSGAVDPNSPIECPVIHEYVSSFRSLASKLKNHAQRDPSLSAPHLLGWLERILVAVTERAISWESSQKKASSEIGHQGSAYELVNSFLNDCNPREAHSEVPATARTEMLPDGAEDFWSEFMSDWLKW